MDAVKCLRTKWRMCETYPKCNGCPMGYEVNKYSVGCSQLEDDFSEEAVEIVKKWSEEHSPE